MKKAEDLDYVRDQILETVKAFQEKPVDAARLDTVRKRLRYQVALSMDNSDTIAQILSSYVALKRTPETMNALYDQYAKLTPEDVQAAAKLPGGEGPHDRDADRPRGCEMKSLVGRASACQRPLAGAVLLVFAPRLLRGGADSHRGAAREIAAGDLPHRVHDRSRGGPRG